MGICAGRVTVGLTSAELRGFARGSDIPKVSSRDLGPVLAAGGSGATTVAATMVCARLAGIRVFATGGIGGVHRDVLASWDVSADLTELARTRVAVVCSGAKSILDLPRTVQALETLGVPVLGYRTDGLPAFYARDSGLPVDRRCESPEDIAQVIAVRDRLDLPGGELVANPVDEAFGLDLAELEDWLREGLDRAAQESIAGKALTPFLLAKLAALSGGRTVAANEALLRGNAVLGASLAKAYAAR